MGLSILTTLVLAIAVGLAGCRTAPRDGKVHFIVWSGWTGAEGKAFQGIVDRFNATHPKLHLENLGGVQDDTNTIRAITAGVPPDLFFLWTPPNLGPLVSNGAVLPLDDRFRRSGMSAEQFVPAAIAMGRVGNRLYSLPYLVDCSGLYWNRAAFREVGLDPDRPPETMEELSTAAARLTRRDARGNVLRLGLDPPDWNVVLQMFGGRLLDERGAPTADDPRNLEAFRWYRDLVKGMGGISQIDSFASGFGQGQGPNHPFFVGKTSMMISGEWIPWWIERYAPKLDYGLTSLPPSGGRPEQRGANLVGGNPICIPTESRHPDEAWEFIRWVQTPEAQIAFAQGLNNVPNVRSVLGSPILTQGSPRKQNYAKFLQFVDRPNAGSIPPSPVMNYYLAEMLNARDFVLHGHKTPEEALRDVQRKVLAELARSGPPRDS